MMAFCHVMGRLILEQNLKKWKMPCRVPIFHDSNFLFVYRRLKIRMKLGYECFRAGATISELFNKAIETTLNECEAVAIADL